MKGSASHNYSLKCSCTVPELHQHSLSLAPHWRGLSGSSGRDVSRNTIQKPMEPAQVHLESWAVLSTLRRSRDTPDPTLAHRGRTSTHTASSEETSKSFYICFTYLPCWQDRSSFRTKRLDLYSPMCIFVILKCTKPLMKNLPSSPQRRDLYHM